MEKILIVDDDEEILVSASGYLKNAGYIVLVAGDGQEGFEVLNQDEGNNVKLIITDLSMPVINGIEFCRIIRNHLASKHLPILMLTSLDSISDKYMAFDSGADDYLTKPFELLELLLRTRSLLKKYSLINNVHKILQENLSSETLDEIRLQGEYENNSVIIDESRSIVRIKGKNIYLTTLEISILYYLFKNAGKTVSIEELLEKIMSYPAGAGNPEAIRTHIKNLRAKIEEDPANPKILINVPRRGYMYAIDGLV